MGGVPTGYPVAPPVYKGEPGAMPPTNAYQGTPTGPYPGMTAEAPVAAQEGGVPPMAHYPTIDAPAPTKEV